MKTEGNLPDGYQWLAKQTTRGSTVGNDKANGMVKFGDDATN